MDHALGAEGITVLRAVHLHGRLGKRFGRRFDLAVSSPTEAIRALIFMVPGFSEYIRHRGYVVTVGEGTILDREALDLQLGRQTDIHITPAGMVSGIETVLLGAVLLVTAAASIAVLSMPKVPTAASREESTKTASYIFDGAENVTEQGHPVPLVYGRFRVGSVVGSAGITTSDANEASVSADPSNPYLGNNYGGYVGSTPGIRGSAYGDEWVQLQKGGKGGGGGTARAAQEDPNSLQSQATAKVLDIVSEGEIVGLVDGMKSIYFDDTPLQNADGSFNFAGIAIEQRVGLPDQDFIPGFGQNENSREINTQVRVALGPVTRTVQNQNATVARVTIRLPQLYQQDTTNGDLKASTVAIKISVQADGGGFTDVLTKTFTGKTNSGYQWSTDIRLPNGAQRDIRVTRLTPDSEVASLSNETHWDLLTEVVEAKLSYPDTALFGLTVDARQFGSSVPARSYDIKGLIVEVPSNYDPVARTYAGVWDGTWKRAWTDNPAWVFRDIIVNRRYGLGTRVAAESVDKWGLYAIAQHCDGMIPDGSGGMRPRYTINVCIKNPAAAYDVLASIASNFRGFAYWGSGAVVAVQDRPEDPSVLITPANVVDGKISYSRITPIEKRRSVAVVYWNDPDDGYRLTPEIVEDPDLIRRFGRRGDSGDDAVTAFGVTNRGQAHTMCRWLLEDEAPGSNAAATYEVGDDHGFVEPGRVAEVADPMFTQSRRGGRVRAATPGGLTLDAPYAFKAGPIYSLRVTMPDGTVSVRSITNAPGTTATVTLGGANWVAPPNAGAVWTIETDQTANRQFRVRSISTDDPPHSVRAVLHDPTKWDRVELDRDISTPNFIDLPTGPLKAPDSIDVFEFLLRDGDAAIPCAQVSWRASDSRITFYQAQSKAPGQNWEPFADSVDTSRIVRAITPGEWSFRVRGLDSLGRKTKWIEASFVLGGQREALPNVTGLMPLVDSETLQSMIVWVMPTDPRPLMARIWYSETGSFAGAIPLGTVNAQEWVVSKVGTYWVQTRFLDAFSVDPPSVLITAADLPYIDFAKITGPTKPQDNATVGAPDDTYVGSRLAKEMNRLVDLNGENITGEILRGNALRAYTEARTSLDNRPIGTVFGEYRANQEVLNDVYAQNFSFLGARNGEDDGWILNADSIEISGTGFASRSLTSLTASVDGVEADITNLQEIIFDPTGATLRSLNILDLDGNITGTVNTITGEQSDYTIYANVFRIVNPNGGQPFTPFQIGFDGVVEMLSVRVGMLAAASVSTETLALFAVGKDYAVELGSNFTNIYGSEATVMSISVVKDEAASGVQVDAQLRMRALEWAGYFTVTYQPQGGTEQLMDTLWFWPGAKLEINGVNSLRLPVAYMRRFQGIAAGAGTWRLKVTYHGGNSSGGWIEAGSGFFIEEKKR